MTLEIENVMDVINMVRKLRVKETVIKRRELTLEEEFAYHVYSLLAVTNEEEVIHRKAKKYLEDRGFTKRDYGGAVGSIRGLFKVEEVRDLTPCEYAAFALLPVIADVSDKYPECGGKFECNGVVINLQETYDFCHSILDGKVITNEECNS